MRQLFHGIRQPLLSVRTRFFATTLTLIIIVELISGLISRVGIKAWLFTQHTEQSEQVAREIAQRSALEGGAPRTRAMSDGSLTSPAL